MGVPMEQLRRRVRAPRSGEPDVASLSVACSNPPGAARFDHLSASPSTAISATESTRCWPSRCSTASRRRREARRISLSVSRPSLVSAQLADVISAFYRGRPAAGPGGGVGAITDGMIGMPEGAPSADDTSALAATLSKKTADGTPEYTSAITSLVNTAESAVLIRNLLLAQHDGNAAIVVAGPATGVSQDARALPRGAADHREVQAAGRCGRIAFRRVRPSPRSRATSRAATEALRRVADADRGGRDRKSETRCRIPGASIEKDFAWSPAHPVVDAYRAFKPMPYDAPASALAAVLHAVHPDDGYFTLSEPGTITRARRRPDAVYAGSRRQASVSRSSIPTQKARIMSCIPLWFPRRRLHGRAAGGGAA